MVFFGEAFLPKALREFETHYYEEQNHQGLDNLLIDPGDEVGNNTARSNAASVPMDCCDTTTTKLPSNPVFNKRSSTFEFLNLTGISEFR